MKDLYVERRKRVRALKVGYEFNAEEIARINSWLIRFGWNSVSFKCDKSCIVLEIESPNRTTRLFKVAAPCFIVIDQEKEIHLLGAEKFYSQWEPE